MRLIDADALYEQAADTAEHYCGFFNDMEKVISARDIDAAPTIDAVPVVRCRDCKHYKIGPDMVVECTRFMLFTAEDDYCSSGAKMQPTQMSGANGGADNE